MQEASSAPLPPSSSQKQYDFLFDGELLVQELRFPSSRGSQPVSGQGFLLTATAAGQSQRLLWERSLQTSAEGRSSVQGVASFSTDNLRCMFAAYRPLTPVRVSGFIIIIIPTINLPPVTENQARSGHFIRTQEKWPRGCPVRRLSRKGPQALICSHGTAQRVPGPPSRGSGGGRLLISLPSTQFNVI